MIEETNTLLQKAANARPNDFQPVYFQGFNAFYFQHDAEKAAPFLRKAATLPGSPSFLQGLAARFSLYGQQTEMGIAFLKTMLENATDERVRIHLQKRLTALEIIQNLETQVKKFHETQGVFPTSLEELLEKGLLKDIPKDPYGGNFVIYQNGRVYTTSELVPQK